MILFEKVLSFLFVLFIIVGNNSFCYGENAAMNTDLPNTFCFNDLVELSQTKNPNEELAQKLKHVLDTPIVDNTIASDNVNFKENPTLGKYIRVASWNIERGFNLDNIELLFNDPDTMIKKLKTPKPGQVKIIRDEIEQLKNSDIIVLNEVDIGMPRTKYRDVVEELAKNLNFNYAYGVEFVEVDPAHLGLSDNHWSEERLLFPGKTYVVDKDKYKGLHGTAIISRFKLNNVKVLRLPEAYDWFNGEKKRVSDLEKVKRNAAVLVFKEGVIREIRQGSRIALMADAQIPGQEKPITVVALHLENRAAPSKRREQMGVVLNEISHVNNPVVMAGDFNTMTGDGSPTGLLKEVNKKITDLNFVAKEILLYGNPYDLAINSLLFVTDAARKSSDPTVRNIPVIAPNAENGLFADIKKFKFDDGYTFDFRGSKDWSTHKKTGNLANSNERNFKAFVPTFVFDRSIVMGKYKLDWIFVKSYAKSSNNKDDSYKMAPVFARTLYELNYGFRDMLSDHAPLTVDLPLNEPNKKGH